jgi:hypothetical protein
MALAMLFLCDVLATPARSVQAGITQIAQKRKNTLVATAFFLMK